MKNLIAKIAKRDLMSFAAGVALVAAGLTAKHVIDSRDGNCLELDTKGQFVCAYTMKEGRSGFALTNRLVNGGWEFRPAKVIVWNEKIAAPTEVTPDGKEVKADGSGDGSNVASESNT